MFLDDGRTTSRPREDRDVVMVSDLHVGVREPFGFPLALETVLATLVTATADEGSLLVLNGDILDAGVDRRAPRTLLETVPRLCDALAHACEATDVYYVMGNHDPPRAEIARTLGWTVVDRLALDDGTLFTHGHELDPGLRGTFLGRSTEVLQRVERVLGQDFEFPVGERSSLAARSIAATALAGLERLHRHAPSGPMESRIDENMTYLASMEEGRDPSLVLATLARCDLPRWVKRVVCGHTHRPGLAVVSDVEYVNLGTWSTRFATFARLRDDRVTVRDAITGRSYGLEAYERWEEPTDWRAWRARPGPLRGSRVLRDISDRALGSAFAWAPGAKSLVQDGLSPLLDGVARAVATAAAPVAAEAEEDATSQREAPIFEDRAASLAFVERLSGTLRMFDAKESIAIEVDLEAIARWSGAARSATLRGRVTALGLATDAEARGTLSLGADFGLVYDIAFTDDGGRALKLAGRKTLRLFDLSASLRELPLAVLDAGGEPIGEADLAFDLRADLGGLIRSLRLVAPRTKDAARAAIGVDPLGRAPELAHTARRVVVTGASGHLGYHLVAQLLSRGHAVTALVRSPPDAARFAPLRALRGSGELRLVRGDVLAPASLRAAFDGADGVVHAAAGFHLSESEGSSRIIRPTVEGTATVLRMAGAAGVRRVVLTSSIAALGFDATGREPLDERDWATESRHPYHRAKTLAERRAWSIASETGLDLVVINPATFLGPNFFVHTAATRFVADLVLARVPILPPFRLAWVDVRDVAHAHVLALENEAAHGRYPLAAQHASFEDLVSRMSEVDPDIELPRHRLPDVLAPLLPAFDRARSALIGTPTTLPASLFADIAGKETRVSSQRARAELGWEPIPFEQTLVDTIQWVRDHYGADVSA